jgi:hypothetical protein
VRITSSARFSAILSSAKKVNNAMTIQTGIPVASLSIWDPIHLGTDETGNPVYVNLAERNMLIGGNQEGAVRRPPADRRAWRPVR